MSRWPTVKHFTSWLGLCPHQRVSGGKVLSRRTKSCANRAATALRLAAAALHHSQSALGAFFRRMKARLGAPKAITATAHKLARLIYTMLKHGTAYVRQGMDEYEQQYRDRTVKTYDPPGEGVGVHPGQSSRGCPRLTGTPGSSSLEGAGWWFASPRPRPASLACCMRSPLTPSA